MTSSAFEGVLAAVPGHGNEMYRPEIPFSAKKNENALSWNLDFFYKL